ncbi:hypothetical protein F2P56_026602 [Juglans regia]|uniref:Membrane protein of ER body-like protein n=1 Tax=Juglans regia TaxID=51240 RepID=A0A833X0Q2_JUGRE|nr:hypothetical protein F2P56_026602 [Juglans regia]
MEAELEQRRELEEEAAEGGGGGEFDLQRRQPRQHNNGSTTTVTINVMGTSTASLSSSSAEYSLEADLISQLAEEGEFSYESFALTSGEVNVNDSINKSTTPGTGTVMVDIATESFGIETIDELFKPTDPPPSNKNSSIQEQIAAETSIDIGTIEQEGRVGIDIREEIEEQKETRDYLYLETVYKKPATSDFYCPNCQACIDKVLIRSRLEEEEIRCPSCFEFLKPLAQSWLPKWRGTQQTPHPQKPHVPIDTIIQGNEEPTDQLKPGDTSHRTPSSTSKARTPTAVKGEIPEGNKEPTNQLKPGDTLRPPLPLPAQSTPEQDGTIKLEIVKSLVYGGLTESITSLSVVTSAASAAASTLSILVLALANLIGGLFIIGHNLRDLKNEQSRVTLNEAEERVDRYLQLLGQKKNFIIHASVAVISFLVFGLVPPVVYGFSFYKSDNSYLKLAVVAAASLICITILAIAKAYIKRPTRWYMYLRTVTYYVSLGVGASGISYLAGYLFKLLADKLGWFESSAAVTLSLPGMSSVPSAQVSSY